MAGNGSFGHHPVDGAGHHDITREAVRELFASGRADADGRIEGMTEEEYFHALDKAQARPSEGTWYEGPATLDQAPRAHGMAEGGGDGAWNLSEDEWYVEDQLKQARGGHQMEHLGYAAHALEDSYSESHAWRGPSADSGDPEAPVVSFNDHEKMRDQRLPQGGRTGTYDERFDQVPVDGHGHLIHGTDQAAAHATARMLEAYHDHQHQGEETAAAADQEAVHHFYQPGEHGVAINSQYTAAWAAERDQRLAEHAREEHDYGHAAQPCPGGSCPDCAAQHAVTSPCTHPAWHTEPHQCTYGHSWH